MKMTHSRTAGLVVALLLLAVPHATPTQTCENDTARMLLAGGLADAALNPASQEDNQFFTTQGGFPNLFFVMDTSTSMMRLPPNGPASLGVPATGTAGCGTTAAQGGLTSSAMLTAFDGRAYHSPCGTAGAAYENIAYLGAGTDYAQVAAACPYYSQGSSALAYGPGFDPEFYATGSALTVGGGKPNLFPSNLIFHDTATDTGAWSTTNTTGNGWDFTTVYPYGSTRRAGPADIATFCADQGTNSAVCTTCLTERGWYYDGTVLSGTVDGVANVQYPSIWYTGNYLNFYPPKFVVARKVVKDVVANQTAVRMALAQFATDGSAHYDFVADFNPSCQSVLGGGNWESNRSTYINAVNALSWGGAGAPLSAALFDVGRYYHTPSLPWFGGTYEKSGPDWLSAGSANQLAVCWSCQVSSVILLTDARPPADEGNTLPPGASSIADSNSGKYAGDTGTGVLNPLARDCPRCGDFTGAESYKNNLAKVAFYLHNYDMRAESAGACGGAGGTLDGQGMPGKQVLDVYTVGFATGGQADTTRLLSNAATAGGGIFVGADNADSLRKGIFAIFTEVNSRSTSFSVATVSTLQTTTGHSVIVPRFDPDRTPHWPGHLTRYEMFSEFVNACTPGGVGDLDCDGACGSAFLQDKNGAFVGEDGNGNFVITDNGHPPCSQVPECVRLGKTCGTLTNVAATPWWDAADPFKTAAPTWRSRKVYTVTDTAAPLGKLDASDAVVRLDPSIAGTLQPYMALGSTGTTCSTIAKKIEDAGDLITADIVRTSKLECAKTIIRFVLGADVLNEVGRTVAEGWPPPAVNAALPASITNPPDQDQLKDRSFKLGDIYHSSPVVVDAPLPADGVLCPNGLHNQCMESLWRTPVKQVGDLNQYDLYAKSSAYKNRRKVVLVGANDGMLHAFNGGAWQANQNDVVTDGIDERLAPFFGYYDRGEVDGPVELWSFVPPDLLGKLSYLLTGDHQLFVDGTAMVRDVWVDGVGNGGVLSPGANADNRKSASEFHTVAVVGERRGGSRYFALDVTDATRLPTESGYVAPKFLWIYPQPSSAESLQFGETYTDFLPVPPPIGPVRIKSDGNAVASGYPAQNADSPTVFVPETSSNVPYLERWVTILPGGFDEQYVRGRGVHMVDVWTGAELFDFSYAPAATDARRALKYPVAATPAMVMWGKSARRPSLSFENDGYFDTATFGDVGGQLWVLRFNRPGTLDASTGMATNWSGGRIFAMGDQSVADSSLCAGAGGQPFFFITANTALPGSHVYRVYAGTGDRFNLLDRNGGECGPDNIRACAQQGCTVSLPVTTNSLSAAGTGYDGEGLAQGACSAAAPNAPLTTSRDLASSPPACGMTASAQISVSGCPNPTVSGGPTGFTKDVALRCTADGGGDYGCATTAASSATTLGTWGSTVALTTPLTTHPRSRNWYFSLKVFEDSGDRTIFDSPTAATAYDAGRTTFRDTVTSISPLTATAAGVSASGQSVVIIDGSANTPTTLADATSAGWAIYYNHGPTITTGGHTYNVNLLDERTSSVSGLYGKILWNTIQPALGEASSAVSGCATSKCTAAFRRLTYHYAADAVTGGPVFRDASGNFIRSIAGNTLVPPQGDQPTVFVNQKGQIAVGMTAVNTEKGASNLGMTAPMDPVMGLGTVEIGRGLHDCRHAPAGPGDPAPTADKCR
jgi:type IV pilus assembly protein PilY1